MDNQLLAPCNKCPRISDKETGYILGASITLFKTFNGSSRYVYQVHGRSVAVLLIDSHSSNLGRVIDVYSLPDYRNAGLFRDLYRAALKDFKTIRLGNELSNNLQAFELIQDIKTI